jgi:hypothetical protein
MIRSERESTNQIARFGGLKLPFPAISNASAAEKQNPAQSLRGLFTDDYISFKGRMWRVPGAFAGECLAIRPLNSDGHYGIFFASWQVASIDLTAGKSVSHVSEQVSAMSPG